MGRTKPWFFKWLHRYHPGETPPALQKLLTNIRMQLEENLYAQVGVSVIKWEFKKLE